MCPLVSGLLIIAAGVISVLLAIGLFNIVKRSGGLKAEKRCKFLGHKMFFDTHDVTGPSTCRRCGHEKPGMTWPRAPQNKDDDKG